MSFRLIEVTLIDSKCDIWEAKFLPMFCEWGPGEPNASEPTKPLKTMRADLRLTRILFVGETAARQWGARLGENVDVRAFASGELLGGTS